jgi:hypothetical protein
MTKCTARALGFFPILHSLVPPEGIILPIRPDYAINTNSTESLWELQVRSCDNGARMKQGIHFEEYVSPVAMIDSIHILLCMEVAQGNQVYVLDVRNAFQTTFQCYASKRTYNMLLPFFA